MRKDLVERVDPDAMQFGLPFPVSLLCTAALAAVSGALAGIKPPGSAATTCSSSPSARRDLPPRLLNRDEVTGGAVGLPNIAPISLFGHTLWSN